MINKQKLVDSYNALTVAMYNLKTNIAHEGRVAFTNGEINDIEELSSLLEEIQSMIGVIEKQAGKFNSYSLDVVMETHPSEFPLENKRMAETLNIKYPIGLTIDIGAGNVDCIMVGRDTFRLAANQIVKIDVYKLDSKLRARVERLLGADKISYVDCHNDTMLVSINKEIVFKSANSIASFVIGSQTTDGIDLLKVADGTSLREYMLKNTVKESKNESREQP